MLSSYTEAITSITMKKVVNFYLLLILAVICTVSACIKDEYDLNKLTSANYSPEVAMPLVHTKFSVEEILTMSADQGANDPENLEEDPDGLMKFMYSDTLFSKKASDFITFPPMTSLLTNYTGSDTVQLPVDSIDLNLKVYNKVIGGSFYFEDPTIHITVTNSIGMPVDLTFTTFETWSAINGTTIIQLFSTPPPIALTPSPAFPLNPGDVSVTTYTYDKTNSNVQDFLLTAPKYLYYAVRGVTNVPTTIPNFVVDTSEFSVEVLLELPLYGYASFLTLGDTLPFSLGINDPSKDDLYAESATFVVNAYNGFPINAVLQLSFLDTVTNTLLDSLFYNGEQTVFNAGPVGPAPAYRVSSIKHTVTEVFVDKARLDRIGSANKLIIRGTLTTENNPALVKIYSDYTLELKLAVRAELFVGL